MAAPQKGLKGICQAPCNSPGQNSDFVVFLYTLVYKEMIEEKLRLISVPEAVVYDAEM